MLEKFKKTFIGDRKFYGYVMRLAIPMILQNVVTSFVSLLDNIMVGRVGTEQMSGVAIANQLIFVFQLAIFGAVSGPGIFGAQFFGKGDYEGQKYTARIRVFASFIITILSVWIFSCWGDSLIGLYLVDDGAETSAALTLQYGKAYMDVMLLGLLPFGLGQAYASMVRECGFTAIPMIGSVSAVVINLVLDYGLIFGKIGFPEMGVRGAALATVIAKVVECLVIIIWTHCNTRKVKFAKGLYKSVKVPAVLFRQVAIKSAPLMCNEILWSVGMATLNRSYALRGLEVVAAQNIANTMINLFNIIYVQLGACISIIVGQQLGAGNMKRAREYCYKVIFFCVMTCFVMMVPVLPLAALFPEIYKTSYNIKNLATFLIRIQALAMPLVCIVHCSYFTLRSGGKTVITFLFDSVFVWVVMIPLSLYFIHYTGYDIRLVYFYVTFSEILKVIIGILMVRSNMWMNNIVESHS